MRLCVLYICVCVQDTAATSAPVYSFDAAVCTLARAQRAADAELHAALAAAPRKRDLAAEIARGTAPQRHCLYFPRGGGSPEFYFTASLISSTLWLTRLKAAVK